MSTNIQVLPGKVGISNTNPTHTLDIGSNVYVDDTGTDVLTVNGQVNASNVLVGHEINIGALKITATRGLQSDENFNVSSNLEVGTANLFVDTTTGRVGIGVTDPGSALDVSGDVEISSNVTAANSKFSLDTNGTFKQDANENGRYIKLTKYFANASNWKIATGSYAVSGFQWLSIRAKMTRLDVDVETIQFNYYGSGGISRVRDPIVIGGGGSATQANEIKVYNKTADSTYEIYLQIDSATTVEVEISHRGSTIDDDYSTVAAGAIDETGLTKIYDSGTTTDLRLKAGNVGIGTTNPQNSLHLFKASVDQISGLFIEKQNSASGTAQITFGVNASDENVGVAKAGIFFQRTATNGLGSLKLAVDSNSDGNDVGVSDSLITLKDNYYVGFGPNLDPEQLFHFVRNTEDDHVYIKFGKARTNITSQQYWKPYMYAAANSTNTQYAYTTYYSNGFFIGVDQMDAGWGSNYYGGNVDIRAGNIFSPGNNGSAHSTNYNGGNIILQGGTTRTGSADGQTSRTYGGSIIFKTQSTDTYANTDANAYERMRVDGPTGRVGIATSSPSGTLHVEANDRVHFTKSIAPFTGLEVTNSRSQLVLSSNYSDLVLASRVSNNSHGSTVSFAAVDPNNAADYRKFVINQGAWGSRSNFLSFGYADGSYSNPHSVINGTYTTMTIDGYNRRVGIANESPSYNLDVGGAIRATARIHANNGIDLPLAYGYCAILQGPGDAASYSVFNSKYRTWYSVGVTDYQDICRIIFDARAGSISGSGSVGSTSDDRLKINEKRITRATDTILKLDPQLYHKTNKTSILPKEGEDVLYQTESGLIAQDIWYDAPELRHLVRLGNGADPDIEKPYRNPDITIDPDYSGWGPEPATVNYVGLIPYLIKSVQEITTELPNVKTNVSNVNVSNVDNYHGLIVSANKPDVYISTSSYDTKCYGVVSEENVETINNEILINTSRDGKVWVIDVENLQSGDYITTSNVAGYGMKQSDDLVHNYTVAKILQDCDFNPTQVPIKRVMRETRDVKYYVRREYSDVPQDGSEAHIHENKIVEIDEVYYTKSTLVQVEANKDYTSRTFIPEITEEAYDALDESDRESYAVTYFNTEISEIRLEEYGSLSTSEKEEYEQKTRRVRKILTLKEMKEPVPGHEMETRTEEVDVLDSNGQLVWEETGETRASYIIKYIDGAGVETDEANAVHKAALVNCKVVL